VQRVPWPDFFAAILSHNDALVACDRALAVHGLVSGFGSDGVGGLR
jgi:hypothetical protein